MSWTAGLSYQRRPYYRSTSLGDEYGINPPKWNSVRNVPISQYLREELLNQLKHHPLKTDADAFIFYGNDPRKPMNRTTVMENFYIALRRVGITDDLREERNILFHSWRHYFNTNMRQHVNDSVLRAITGHKTIQMTENYTHYNLEHFSEIRKIQDEMFSA